MEHLGYHIVYDQQFDITTTDFNQYVIAMRNAGVKILFIEQMPQNYAAAVVKALTLQNFHPVLVLGASTYSQELVPNSGGAAAIDGAYLEQGFALYLGEDAASIPAVNTFLTWVQSVSPGFKPDLFTLFGWLSGELFAQALQSAGTEPDPGLGAEGAPRDHLVQRREPHRPVNPAAKIAEQLLHHRPHRRRQVRTSRHAADRRSHPRVPLRPALLLPAVVAIGPPAPAVKRLGSALGGGAAARRMSRALRLAAWFLWITPLAAALSIRLTASRNSSSRSSASDSIAAVARLVLVRSSERTDLLRAWRLAVCRLRLIWLRMLATGPCLRSLQ